ncbi:hypothetical protein KHA96_16275 [Bacillus sp. FJAT-49711]|uniref:hypothetical protein n=1 Tax=Bacillus sp. FJAT-49711 TaxID=2833585 RepID=UPI001BC9B6D5|nr:hypothetical protein [Bacillus sp. FJAT-49711]MBS4219871.1 hypothetical protein [Bacillus sp. FJAT-49711]
MCSYMQSMNARHDFFRLIQFIRPNHTVNGFMDTYIWEDDVDIMYEDLKTKGAILEAKLINLLYGMRGVLVYDVDGYRFCIGGPSK